MTKERTLRVHVVELDDGRLLGTLIRTRESFFDELPPSAYGESLEEVLAQLEQALRKLLASRSDEIERYLWKETFGVRTVDIDVHPATSIKKQPVIGRRVVPLRMSFVHCELPGGIHRVMLPRHRFWILLEDLDTAKRAMELILSGALLGEEAKWIYELRKQGEESVVAHDPGWLEGFAPTFDATASDDLPMPAVEAVAEDWIARAAGRKAPVLIGSDALFEEESKRFALPPWPSVLIVGDPGVGKTTFVRRLAKRLLRHARDGREVPRRLWATSADRIIAGMIYLGQWQERCLRMVDELEGEGHYLYVGNLLPLLRAQSDGSSIADLFAPAVESGAIPLIAECTPSELVEARRRSARFLDAFRIIRIGEPRRGTVVPLLATAARREGLDLHPAALDRLVRHLEIYSRGTRFPGKGFRLLDWLARQEPVGRIDPMGASTWYARHAGLPVDLIADERSATVDEIAEKLRAGVVGQDDACRSAARVLARLKAGLTDPDKPIGTLLFAGPTGVGKTELAKQLAQVLFGDRTRMVRIDMSELMVPGAVYRLRQVGRGATSLAQRVRSQPLSLVLFDEVEKAHPEVFDLLLGILGEGRLTDAIGRLVDFRMTVIVMTSNLGSDRARTVGFDAPRNRDYSGAVRDFFRPELVNRVDHIVSFRNLEPADLRRIVELELDKSRRRAGLARRNLTLVVDPSARARLAELGWHPSRGARPLRRVIEERVFTPLAARIAGDAAFRDRRVRVVIAGSEHAEHPDSIVV